MAEIKFHLTPKGQARPCMAQTAASCKYSKEAGEIVEHYDTKQEAQQAYEEQAFQEHGSTKALTKKPKTKNIPQFKENGDTTYKGVSVIEDQVIYDQVKFTRLNQDNMIDTPYSIRVQVGKELTEQESQKVAQLFGYEYAKTGGERGNHFEQDSPNSIIVYADTTKGRSYRRLDEFVKNLPETLKNGTPIRKTDKAGTGTKGTRLVDGFGDLGYVELYADDTYNIND